MSETRIRVVFDIDGTLSDPTHRLHFIKGEPKQWDEFFAACGADLGHAAMIETAKALDAAGHFIEFWTGRPERARKATTDWLRQRGLYGAIRMREDGDHRPDHVVKMEYLDAWTPDVIFEDRRTVVDAYRARGVVVVQVAPGDF